jgi:small conductance mechanosensitive channel
MNLIIAAAADAGTTTNTIQLLTPNSPWVERFENATGLPREVAVWGVNALAALIIVIIGYIVAGFVRRLVKNVFARRNIDPTIGGFVGNIVHVALMTFVIITALGQLGVDTKTFAAVIAAAGLAIGLALQGGLSNFAAGFLIVVFRPFKVGDFIAGAGVEGKVQEVQIFCTTLNTVDNKRVIVPNGALMAGVITNFTANGTRRVDVPFAVSYGQDLARIHDLVLNTANADPRVLKDPAAMIMNVRLLENGMQLELRAWCNAADYGAVLSTMVAQIPVTLAAAKVKGPDRTVYYVERKGESVTSSSDVQ